MQRLLTIIILLTIAGLLVFQRFNAPETLKVINLSDQEIHRGKTIQTNDSSELIKIGDNIIIGLDARTDLRIDRIFADEVVVHLSRGRIMIQTDREIVVTTNFTKTVIQKGSVSLVNYDFRETVSIIPFDTPVAVITQTQGIVTTNPIDIHETKPVEITESTFDPKTSSAADFYEWFHSIIPPPIISSPS